MREGCVLKTLGDLFSIGSSKRVYESQWRTKGVPFYRAREIVRLSRDGYVDNELFIDEELYVELSSKYGIPKAGDIMVTGVGTLGICYIVKENDRFYFKDGNTLWFKTKEGTNPQYVQYAFKSEFLRRQIDNCVGATVGTFTIERANKTTIPVPSFEEQERIVAELDLLTGIIDKQKRQLKELDNLAQSIFYDMFGNPDTNSKGWLVKKLGELCKSDLGKTLNASKDTGKMRPYLCAINIHWNEIDLSTLKQTKFEDEELERYSVVKGDLLVCEGGDVGRSAIWKEDRVIQYQNALHRIRFGKEIIAIYCLFVLQYLKVNGILDGRYGKGVTIKHLVKSSLLSIPIPVPPIEFQREFADKIQSIESQKESINRSIAESQKLFDYTMDKYFG